MTEKTEKLTPKQEAFACFYVETGVASEAYRRAYDVDPSARDEWIHVESCQLLDHPKVSRRVKELQEELAELRRFTRLRAMEELDEARDLALQEKQSSAAIKATEVKIRMLGLEAPSRHELTGLNGKPIQTEDVTNDADAFARRMASLAAGSSEEGNEEPDATGESSS
ncbi:MAG: terminase small subunit [Pseudomonadota bacterium]